MSAPSRPTDPPNPSIGAVLRMLFQSGASDDVVTRFVALHANAMSANPLPPLIEFGPALQQAAQSAGVEVARELLGQIEQVKQATRAHAKPPVKGKVYREDKENQGGPATAARHARKTQVEGDSRGKEIYRLDVASGRTSVSLPVDLLAAARAAFGEPDLTKLVQQLYGQALSTKASAANKAPNSGPSRKVNKSFLVREALSRALAARQVESTGLGTFH